MMNMDWGFVTDEVAEDPCAAMRLVSDWGIRTVELRSLGGNRRIPDLALGQETELLTCLASCGLTISALSPGTWKCGLRDAAAADQPARFAATLDLAERWGVRRIISFAVRRSPTDRSQDYEQVRDILCQMTQDAVRRDIILCVENERGWWLDTEAAMLRLLGDLGPIGLRLNWDAANYVDAGGRQPLAVWRRLKPWIANVHLKDICLNAKQNTWCLLGQGEVGWPALLKAMLAEGQVTPLTIETHCQPAKACSRANLDWLIRQMQATQEAHHD
jgi:sugar phosphate isomerase/epimerase